MSDFSYELRGDNQKFFNYKGREAIISGPAETGKTLTGLLKLHGVARAYPGVQLAILRSVYADLVATVLITWRRDVMGIKSFKKPHPYINVYGGSKPQWFQFDNGSRIWAGGLDNPGKTLSGERDIIFVAQAEQLSLSDWEHLIRSTTGRGSIMPYTQLIGDCNPASQNHWILNRSQVKLFETSHKDNPSLWQNGKWTKQGHRTIKDLSSFSGVRYKRLFQGLWCAPEGMIYDVFDSKKHVVKSAALPKNWPPRSWPRIVGIDPFGDRVTALWLALDPLSQKLFVYREYSQPFGATTQGHVENIRSLCRDESILYFCGGGPSERQVRADFRGFGLPLLKPSVGDVWIQIDRVYSSLKANKLFILESCVETIAEISEYHRKSKAGQVKEGTIANKERFHCLDALRYALIGPEVQDPGSVEFYNGFYDKTGINY